MSISAYRVSGIALAAAAAFALGIVSALATITATGHRGAHPQPNTSHTQSAEPDGFPTIDWDYWEEVNPQVVGWITIPGTKVDLPIAQPPAGEPDFYLDHDVYGMPNFTGCPYIDAQCVRNGGLLTCWNSLVSGHNMGWNDEMFGELDSFLDADFARNHREVLIQTPCSKVRLKVQAVSVVPGWEHVKRVSFDDEDDFFAWWDDAFIHSAIKLAPQPDHRAPLVTLCTCSYSQWQDERTLIYLMSS